MDMLNVSDIQHFSVGDGDGIRTTLFLKGCNLRCPWCHNPETLSPKPVELFYKESGKRVCYGKMMTPRELFPILTRDAEFFRASGGGVTVSGGEPLLQASALIPLLKMLKDEGLHVIIDTAGCVQASAIESVSPFVDCFFFDWKSPRDEVYSDTVGGSLELVRSNIARIIQLKKEIRIRIPVIPGVNDSLRDAEKSRLALLELGVSRVDILPFHRLGSGKYAAMGLDYPYGDVPPIERDYIARIADVYRQSFTVTIEK